MASHITADKSANFLLPAFRVFVERIPYPRRDDPLTEIQMALAMRFELLGLFIHFFYLCTHSTQLLEKAEATFVGDYSLLCIVLQ
ncbi:hypothetical protein N7512_006628 [Penicillium capsulatum]|nr:hypothetical protein N7512_006628 [Penicillium capsulatum]